MLTPSWQLQTPVDAIIFDCDGTLSLIEGIDFLAENKGVGPRVKQLTADAMGKTGLTPDLYQTRLELVAPTLNQVTALGQDYFLNQTKDAQSIIQFFKKLNKSIYIVSAGLYPALAIFADLLGLSSDNVFAVDIEFDTLGNYVDFNHSSPLITNDGKQIIVNQLKKKHHTLAYIGDGLNDYSVYDLVRRFIGYGGAYYRENIAACCQFYITTLSLTPVVPLLLTQNEYQELEHEDRSLYQQGLVEIEQGRAIIRN